jgi:hypothetical protein
MNLQERIEAIKFEGADIYEHIPILIEYGKHCKHITEMGTRNAVSSNAFALACPDKLIMYDINKSSMLIDFLEICSKEKINFQFYQQNVLDIEIEETDLLFIDTWHVYEQLKNELNKHGNRARKYIIMHDTQTFGCIGEGYTGIGLLPAIVEWLADNHHWGIVKHYKNNNGLTILKRR